MTTRRFANTGQIRRFAAIAAVLAALLGIGVAQAGAYNYTPGAGTVVSDAGFRPDANGFSFENYTNDNNPQNLDASAMRHLFGPGVCAQQSASGPCALIPAGREWMQATNSAMGGGHCYGMAAIASFFYASLLNPSPFGSDSVPQLQVSQPLQNLIAYGWAMQKLPAVYAGSRFQLAPNQVLNVLNQLLPSREPLIVTIFQRNGSGGHAITPFAIEDRGGGNFAILVYDNNYPGQIREVRVDTNANSWSYSGATDPSISQALYEGDAGTKSLGVEAVRTGLSAQPCPFCGGQQRLRQGTGGGANEDATQVMWQGNPGDGHHSNVSIVDSDGNRSGCSADGCENNIPDATLVPTILGDGDGVPVWEESPPPSFDLPSGQDFKIDLDGNDMNESDTEGISVVRGGVSFDVQGLEVDQGDNQQISVDQRQITLPNESDHNVGPVLGYGDVEGGSGYEINVDTSGVDPDAKVELTARPQQRRLELDFEGKSDDTAGVQVTVRRVDENGHTKRAHTSDVKLGDGKLGTVSYTNRAMRDGHLGLKQRRHKKRRHKHHRH